MISQYERSTKIVIPAIRSSISRALSQDYGMTEEEIAGKLGIAQAAVSKYLTGRYSKEVKAFESKISKKELDIYVKKINNGDDAGKFVCMLCKKLRDAHCYIENGV